MVDTRSAIIDKLTIEIDSLKRLNQNQVKSIEAHRVANSMLEDVSRRVSSPASMNDALKEDLNDRNARVEQLRMKVGEAHKEIVKLRSKISSRNVAINKLVNRLIEDSSD